MLLNFLHKLDAADCHGRAVKPFQSEHRSDPLLDAPMILLDHCCLDICSIALGHASATGYPTSILELHDVKRRRRRE
jgi:hypothetical protein